MNQLPHIIILLGPNGVGKSHICRIISAQGLCEYFSIEEVFMDKYKSLANFQQHRDEAYQYFENIIRSANTEKVIIFEESGISDQAPGRPTPLVMSALANAHQRSASANSE